MKKNFQIEFWIKEEAIDHQDYDAMPCVPLVGDKIFLLTKNDSANSEHGEYFLVTQRNLLFWTDKQKALVWLTPITKEEFYK